MKQALVFDSRPCTLGEGLLWHPQRRQLFWFDILGKKLLSQDAQGAPLEWQFDEHVSAAGWLDGESLLLASETALWQFDLASGAWEPIIPLEADNPVTRSNDGRADPWGGFWIGTMGKNAESGAGAIYRFYRGELRQMYPALTIPNAICFSPDRQYAYFADTPAGMIWRQALEPVHGWPSGKPETFIDCREAGVNPDGAVVDAGGNLWNAQWGASRVACYDPQGVFISSCRFPATQVSCPAFGDPELTSLYATSAMENLSANELASQPQAGKTFVVDCASGGQREHQVLL